MNRSATQIYRCPYSGDALHLESIEADGPEIVTGFLVSPDRRFRIDDGVPRFLIEAEARLDEQERRELAYYEAASGAYDHAMTWLFRSFHEDEAAVRTEMLSALGLSSASRVLEVGCGTCRDSVGIAARMPGGSQLFLQDLSPQMLAVGRDRMRKAGYVQAEYSTGHARHLPFPDRWFDAVFHFGGLNLFTDLPGALAEMARVTRVGGRITVGDEGLAPWLRDTTYGRILLNSNPLYRHGPPLASLPEVAREVRVRWLLGNAFYLVDFSVGDGPPPLDLDLPIPGARGGTHRSRYYGRLEGVTVEARARAEAAAREAGVSLHEWLDTLIRTATDRDGRERS